MFNWCGNYYSIINYLKNPTTVELIIAIIPVLIAAGLVMPVRNYHNVMQLLNNMLDFILIQENTIGKVGV